MIDIFLALIVMCIPFGLVFGLFWLINWGMKKTGLGPLFLPPKPKDKQD